MMIKPLFALACALALTAPLAAQDVPKEAPSPGEIVAAATASEWRRIAPEDLLVVDLAPDARGTARRVVIQLMPAPFSRGWVDNIRTLARAKWYDGIAVVRVQDNYVVQWGDPNHDNPEAAGPAKPLPQGLEKVPESQYVTAVSDQFHWTWSDSGRQPVPNRINVLPSPRDPELPRWLDPYAGRYGFLAGMPFVVAGLPKWGDQNGRETQFPYFYPTKAWPVHCYGMVGVGRNLSPDTGTGAELYTVIGHAPRHLDRNIALIGRVIEGIEHLSSLPRGTGDLGFYKTAEERTPIVSVRVASDLAAVEQPRFEYLYTDGEIFARYAEARANRHDAFFMTPAGGADICNVPVPVRRSAGSR